MKKLVVAVVIVGAFVLYSFLYHSSTAAVLPTTANQSGSSTDASSTSVASSTPGTTSTSGTSAGSGSGNYKDGTYTGGVADAVWGNVQVKVVVQNGRITSVQFLQYPNDRGRSIEINQYADPQLIQEAIQAQSANVDIVTGATDTSDAFIQSLTDALAQAH